MRKLFLGAAAVVALAAPGVASAQTGYVGLDYANVDVDGAGSQDGFGVSGAVALGQNFAVDAAVADNDDNTSWGATGHLFTNNSQYLFGGFVGFSGNDDTNTWDAGVEGNYYMNNVTLAGAISYANNDDSNTDVWGVNGEARYFFNDNFKIEGGLGWFNVDNGIGDDSAISAGVGGEYQFASLPVSVGLGWNHIEFDETDISADVATATVRYNFGGTLAERDHSGAGLAGLSGVSGLFGL